MMVRRFASDIKFIPEGIPCDFGDFCIITNYSDIMKYGEAGNLIDFQPKSGLPQSETGERSMEN